MADKDIVGMRVICYEMYGEPQYTGRIGTVTHVDDMGQVHVNWDGGGSLALISEQDSFAFFEEDPKNDA